jgi:hypothetical protein
MVTEASDIGAESAKIIRINSVKAIREEEHFVYGFLLGCDASGTYKVIPTFRRKQVPTYAFPHSVTIQTTMDIFTAV